MNEVSDQIELESREILPTNVCNLILNWIFHWKTYWFVVIHFGFDYNFFFSAHSNRHSLSSFTCFDLSPALRHFSYSSIMRAHFSRRYPLSVFTQFSLYHFTFLRVFAPSFARFAPFIVNIFMLNQSFSSISVNMKSLLTWIFYLRFRKKSQRRCKWWW